MERRCPSSLDSAPTLGILCLISYVEKVFRAPCQQGSFLKGQRLNLDPLLEPHEGRPGYMGGPRPPTVSNYEAKLSKVGGNENQSWEDLQMMYMPHFVLVDFLFLAIPIYMVIT